MDDLLDRYPEDRAPRRPVVCFDATSKQLTEDGTLPIKARPGRVERSDYEYQRKGTRNLFMFCEPKGGWRRGARVPDCRGLRTPNEMAGGPGIS